MHIHFKHITKSKFLKAAGLSKAAIDRIYHHERKKSPSKTYARAFSKKQLLRIINSLEQLDDQVKMAKVFFTNLLEVKAHEEES